jgi:probable phosphoglycerate mutase
MAIFYLIRHAANDFLGRAIAGRQPGVHLNDEGKQQAERLAEILASTPISKVFCSPMDRCLETAAPLAKRLGLPVEISPALNELDFGDWTNQSMIDLDAQAEWQLWNSFRSGTRMPRGELMIDAQARMVAEIHRLRTAFSEARIALVTHGDPVRAALLYFLGAPLDFIHRIEISPASVSALSVNEQISRILFVNRCERVSGVEV